MRISMQSDFLSIFPEATIQILVCEDLEHVSREQVEPWKQRAQEHVRASKINSEHLGQEPEFKEWRDAYSKFGLKPSKFRSSVEALWKRGFKDQWLETSVPAVDLYCHASVVSRVPLGCYDLARITGDIVVRRARAGEEFLGIGEQTPIPVPAGVVIYADDCRVLCFGWNHRDCDYACLRPETSRAVFFADSALSSSQRRAMEGLDLLQSALEEAGCRTLARGTVDREQPQLAIQSLLMEK
jgi:DNA/RNA-binding domain of Phe-tRNA-synthetase-like protein